MQKCTQVLSYASSEYVRQFGMEVDSEPMKINARVLPPPTLKYGQKSKEQTIVRESRIVFACAVNPFSTGPEKWFLEHVRNRELFVKNFLTDA